MTQTTACAHCGTERIWNPNDPIAFCQTPKCSGNAWGGTDDGQLDENPTTVMSTVEQDQQISREFGQRVVDRLKESDPPDPETKLAQPVNGPEVSVSPLRVKTEKVQAPIPPYYSLNVQIQGIVRESQAGDVYDRIAAFLQKLELDGKIGLVQIQNQYTELQKGGKVG